MTFKVLPFLGNGSYCRVDLNNCETYFIERKYIENLVENNSPPIVFRLWHYKENGDLIVNSISKKDVCDKVIKKYREDFSNKNKEEDWFYRDRMDIIATD